MCIVTMVSDIRKRVINRRKKILGHNMKVTCVTILAIFVSELLFFIMIIKKCVRISAKLCFKPL